MIKTRTRYSLAVSVLVGGITMLPAADPAGATPFNCTPGFYQVVNSDGQLKKFNFSNNLYENVGAPRGERYNGVGYNVLDGYMYGVTNNLASNNPGTGIGSAIVKISSDGSVLNLGPTTPALPTTQNFFGGDFDGQGNLVLNNYEGSWFKVNVANMTATPFALSGSAMMPDFAIINGVAYGIEKYSNLMKRVDMATGAVTSAQVTGLPPITGSTPSNMFGAVFVANGSELYISRNSGSIYRVSGYDGKAPRATFFVNSPVTENNDGSTCPTATLEAAAPAVQYILSYDLGGGSGSLPSAVTGLTVGTTSSLAAGTGFTRTGFTFGGWTCDNSIGDKGAGDALVQPAANVVCSAKWLSNSLQTSLGAIPESTIQARDDSSKGKRGARQVIQPLKNDSLSSPSEAWDLSSLRLCGPAQGSPNCSLSTLKVAGEGRYTVGSNGVVNFVPLSDYVGKATAVRYQVADLAGNTISANIRIVVTGDELPSTGNNALYFVLTALFLVLAGSSITRQISCRSIRH